MVPLKLCRITWLTTATLSLLQTAAAFSPRIALPVNNVNLRFGIGNLQRSSPSYLVHLSSSPNDDWGLGDIGEEDKEEEEDPRLTAMRSMLESSWDNSSMGTVPTNPQKAAEAASQSIADAMRNNKNVVMIDLRLPSYDITEGSGMYDILATYDFCSYLSDNLRSRELIRKSLILVRNEVERAEIDGLVSRRDGGNDIRENDIIIDDQEDGDDSWDDTTGLTSSGGNDDVDEFRKKLMSSWETTGNEENEGATSTPPSMAPIASPSQKKAITLNNNSLSHRLGSMVGNNPDIINNNGGPDMFDKVIAAVDENAKLSSDEDALIILAPYDTADIICLRRIMARYGQTRTIIIVNSRIETLPRELDPAVLVYGILPLIARSKSSGGNNDDDDSVGLKAVVMKRYPSNWNVYVDVYGDGFVEAATPYQQQVISEKQFPSPEWIAQRVQAHVEDLSKRQNE